MFCWNILKMRRPETKHCGTGLTMSGRNSPPRRARTPTHGSAGARWGGLLLTAGLLMGWSATAAAQARVTHLVTPAQIRHAATEPWITLRLGDEVQTGDRLRTGFGSRVEITFSDARVMRIGPATEIEVPRLNLTRGGFNVRLRLIAGRMWSNLLRRLRPGQQEHYLVSTVTAVVGVKGTQFGIDLDAALKQLQVTVLRGRVFALPPGSDPGAPKEIPGPREIAPPQEVTKEEWEVLIERDQKLTLRPGEDPRLEPVRDEDLKDPWVVYNLQRDQAMGGAVQ